MKRCKSYILPGIKMKSEKRGDSVTTQDEHHQGNSKQRDHNDAYRERSIISHRIFRILMIERLKGK